MVDKELVYEVQVVDKEVVSEVQVVDEDLVIEVQVGMIIVEMRIVGWISSLVVLVRRSILYGLIFMFWEKVIIRLCDNIL